MRRLALIIVLVAAALPGCATGLGRAVSHAFGGTPESVPAAFDVVEEEYLRASNAIIEDVKAGKATTDLGKARKSALLERLVARQRAVLEALKLLRDYQGAESGAAAEAARQAAVGRWDEIMGIAAEHLAGIGGE